MALDYLRHYGTSKLGGLVLAGALSKLGNDHAMSLLEPNILTYVPGLFANDVATSLAALGGFIRACHAKPLGATDFHEQLGFNCIVPPRVRADLFSRSLDNDDVLADVQMPVLLLHGTEDAVVLPQSSRHMNSLLPKAHLIEIPGVGHSAFREAPVLFNQKLSGFVGSALG